MALPHVASLLTFSSVTVDRFPQSLQVCRSTLPAFEYTNVVTRLTFTKDQVAKIPLIQANLYPQEWLDQKDETDPQGRTNREVNAEVRTTPYPTHTTYKLNNRTGTPPPRRAHPSPDHDGYVLTDGRGTDAPCQARHVAAHLQVDPEGAHPRRRQGLPGRP